MSEALSRALSAAGLGAADAFLRTSLQLAAERLAGELGLPHEALATSRLGPRFSEAPRELEAAVHAFVTESLEGDTDKELAHRAAHVLGELLDRLLAVRMQLEGARVGSASLRRSTGSFFTPRKVAEAVVARALAELRAPLSGAPPSEVPLSGARFASPVARGSAAGVSPSAAVDEGHADDGQFLRICDPAVGGGAFLVECAAALARMQRERGVPADRARRSAVEHLYGVDRSELALATTEVALWLWVAEPRFDFAELRARLFVGDALSGPAFVEPEGAEAVRAPEGAFDWRAAFPEVAERGFDLVIGNPPWVAFAGRSAQALAPEWRAYFRARFRSFAGFPTLHGLFVERAASLCPRGRIALLLPSPLADLDGYRAVREVLTETHRVREPLLELGQDAFEGVVQPSFVLLADGFEAGRDAARPTEHSAGRRAERCAEHCAEPKRRGSPSPWTLAERGRADLAIVQEEPPPVLQRLASAAPLPAELFRELGFQSNRVVSTELLLRAPAPRAPFLLPLLEGRNVREFREDAPRLYLWDDPEVLQRARCRLRATDEYARVDFVIRQTAAITIAARHGQHAFRNSLLAGFANEEFDTDLLVGLLNSSLYRALHVARQRDARQLAFPQVKIAHLRRLPAPPADSAARERVRRIAARASEERACSPELRRQLDDAVARLFGLTASEAESLGRFLEARLRRAPSTTVASQVGRAEASARSAPAAS